MMKLYKKELGSYLNNPYGYILIVLFAVFVNFLFVRDLFLIGSSSMRPFFNYLPWVMLVFVPAVAMRSLSEEKRTNTIEVLLTLPISEFQIVAAKLLAIITLVVIGLSLTILLPVSIYIVLQMQSIGFQALGGNTHMVYLKTFPELFVGYIGSVLLASVFASISLFFSSLTKNQVIALLASILAIFFLIGINTDIAASVLPKMAQDVLLYFGPLYHYENFIKGVVDFRSLIYFVSVITLFIFFTVIDLEKRD